MMYKGHNPVKLLLLVVMSYLRSVHPISAPVILGWNNVYVINNYRLEFDHRDMWVSMGTNNLQQCLKLCWLFTSCTALHYSPTVHGSCQLFSDSIQYPLLTVPDVRGIVVNMAQAAPRKDRLFGCEQRPCTRTQMCVTLRQRDIYKCLPLASAVCGAPPKIPNATLVTDGLGFASYRCRDGFVPIPEEGVQSVCDKRSGQWSSVTLFCRYVECGPPPALEGAEVTYGRTDYASLSRYNCRSGHYSPSENNITIECQSSGQWTDSPSPCRLVDCGQPRPVENGQVQLLPLTTQIAPQSELDTRTLYDGVAIHTCRIGYNNPLVSVQSRCESNGQWSTSISFQCSPLDCGTPPFIENTRRDYATTTFLANVTYQCIDSYFDSDNVTATSQCGQDSIWSNVNMTCVPIDCGPPPDLPGIKIKANSTLSGSEALLWCSNTSHVLNGSNIIHCNESGKWSASNASCIAPPCATPLALPNATNVIDLTDDDEFVIIYTCLSGFQFDTGENRKSSKCVQGTWQDTHYSSSTCNPVNCGSPPQLVNADVTVTSQTFKSIARYICHKGFEHKTTISHLTCSETGSWSQDVAECEKMVCDPPPHVEHATHHIYLEYMYGDEVKYDCEPDFVMKTSNDTIGCTDIGWETTSIECVRTPCGPPPVVLNSTRVIHGDDVIYKCHDTWMMKTENVSKTCLSGKWSNEEVLCVPGQCPSPPYVENSTPVLNSTQISSVVTYLCKDGLRLTNGSTGQRICQANLEWSDEDVRCEEIQCLPPPTTNTTEVLYSDTLVGSSAVYRCKPGYFGLHNSTLESNHTWSVYCNTFGQWSSGHTIPDVCVASVCPESPPIPHAHVVEHNRNINGLTLFHCDEGYIETVTDNVTGITVECQKNLSWSNAWNQCFPVDCHQPPNLTHADVTHRETSLHHRANYTCNDGFKPTGNDTSIVCLRSGHWSNVTIQCVEDTGINCSDPDGVDKAIVIVEGKNLGDSVTYKCFVGYEHWWFQRKVCMANGTWTNNIIQCRLIDCGTPPSIPNARVDFQTTTYGSLAKYVCIGKYKIIHDVKTRSCTHYGKWGSRRLGCAKKGDKICKKTNDIANVGVVTTGFLTGDAKLYRCKNGYRFTSSIQLAVNETTGKYTRLCINGKWNGVKPTCVPVDCAPPPSITHGEASEASTTYSSTVEYTCLANYVLVGPNSRTCTSEGRWSDEVIECLPATSVYCPPPIVGKGMLVSYDSYTIGSKARFTCDKGFVKHHIDIECLNTGHWSRMGDFKCQPVDCQHPPYIPSTNKHVYQTTLGHHVIYKCNLFNDTEDHDHRPKRSQCLDDGTWSGVTSPCPQCNTPSQIPNTVAHQYKSLYSVGEILVFNCSRGFSPFPNSTVEIICGDDGEWSYAESQCIPEVCSDINVLIPNSVLRIGHLDSSHTQSVFYYDCVRGYRTERETSASQRKAVCHFERGWDLLEATCIPVDCGTKMDIPNTFVTTTTTTYLSQITYSCEPGFLATGSVFKSMCLDSGTWSLVDVTCVQCPLNVTIPNGYLDTNTTDHSGASDDPNNKTNSEKASVVCHENFLLYSVSGPVQPEVTCTIGQDGHPRWESLENLRCYQNVWSDPDRNETIHLDNSYDYYDICMEGLLGNVMSISLTAVNDSKNVHVFLAVFRSPVSKVTVSQRDFQNQMNQIEFDGVSIDQSKTSQICIELFTFSTHYTVWLDGVIVGETKNFSVPISTIRNILVWGDIELYNIKISI